MAVQAHKNSHTAILCKLKLVSPRVSMQAPILVRMTPSRLHYARLGAFKVSWHIFPAEILLDCIPEERRVVSVVSLLYHLRICILRDGLMLGISA